MWCCVAAFICICKYFWLRAEENDWEDIFPSFISQFPRLPSQHVYYGISFRQNKHNHTMFWVMKVWVLLFLQEFYFSYSYKNYVGIIIIIIGKTDGFWQIDAKEGYRKTRWYFEKHPRYNLHTTKKKQLQL